LAHTPSAKKRLRQSVKQRLRNKAVKTHLKTRVKRFDAAVAVGDAQEAARQFLLFQRSFDKAVTHGVIHRNMAARKKSIAAAKLSRLRAKPAGA